MRRLIGLLLGFGAGSAATAALLATRKGEEFRIELKRGFEDAMEEARLASEERQRELEAELERKLGKRVITSK
jgi:hypothetical protein